HINGEVCITVKSVKYIFKYMCKGPERADVQVDKKDEIAVHQSMRYLSYMEATWRSLGLETFWCSHTVVRLPVHLSGKQAVQFHEDESLEAIRSRSSATMLTEFFELCNQTAVRYKYPALKYTNAAEHFIWDTKIRRWKERQRNTKVIGRIQTGSPKNIERYCLRILLLHKILPTSFENLRTVDDIIYPTMHKACIAMGLMESDAEWDRCLSEATNYQMPRQLRNLFCIILVFCFPSDINKLWNDHFEALSEDYAHRYSNDFRKEVQVMGHTLTHIDETLRSMISSLDVFVIGGHLPPISEDFMMVSAHENPLITLEMRHLSHRKSELQSTRNDLAKGTHEHIEFFHKVLKAVDDPNENNLFFLEGQGGSGKTFICQIILAEIRLRGKIALACASSGLAALLLMGGRTAHNLFGLPTRTPTPTMSCNYNVNSNHCQLLKEACLIIWDEISMMHRYLIECADRMFQDIMKLPKPFGGKVVIFSGDFKQLLPVIKSEDEHAAVNATFPRSPLWKHICLNRTKLTINMQLLSNSLSEEDKAKMVEFADFLLSVGEGTARTVNGRIQLPDGIAQEYEDQSSLKCFVMKIYRDLIRGDGYRSWSMDEKSQYLAERGLLAPSNLMENPRPFTMLTQSNILEMMKKVNNWH
ncbi:hypothetical protein LEN26_013061, partial [Aphanomyces euteiches]